MSIRTRREFLKTGSLNIGVNGEEYKPILPVFRDAGKATGLVTTSEITHATPAGFSANVKTRQDGETIARQYVEREVDILMGGGHRHYSAEARSDKTDLYEACRKKGYQVARNKKELKNTGSGRILGIFQNGHLPYTLDHRNDPELMESVPTLAEMTDIVLRKLSPNPNGFIIQVEGARVDHAAHANDIGGLIFDQIAFDDTIGVVLAFAENRDDTLVIITTDHGNANPGFSSAPDYNFDQIYNFKKTNSWIQSGLGRRSTVSQIRERVEAATGLAISRREARAYQASIWGFYMAIYSRMTGPSAVLGQIIANHTNVNWISGSHTADYVELASFGPGSEALEGFVRNTDLFEVMVKAAGVAEYTGNCNGFASK